MRDNIKAFVITCALFLGVTLFIWSIMLTEGWSAVVVIMALVFAGVFALVKGIITGSIDDW